jgi:hypothetical protein
MEVARSSGGDTNVTHTGLQGVCRLPPQQLTCFVASTKLGSCIKQAVDLTTGALRPGWLCLDVQYY